MIVRESIEFQRGLEPKEYLGVGILSQILNYAKQKCQEGDWSWSSPSGWLWEIQEDKNIPPDTKLAWYEYLQSHPDYLEIKMDEHGIILEAQEFQRGLEPKKAMNIGLEEQIANFLQERTSSSPAMWISYLLTEGTEEELDKETRKEWIEFLIKKPEYNSNLDENDFYELKSRGIKWIPWVKLPGEDIQYEFKGGKYFIKFSEWENFVDLFDTDSRDISKKFLESVLSGDALEYFEYDSSNYRDISELAWYFKRLKEKNPMPALDELKQKYVDLGGDSKKELEEMLEDIESNSDFSDLHDAVTFAWVDALEVADEEEAYNDLKKEIQKHYQIGEGEWKEGPNQINYFYASISLNGVEKLFDSLAMGEDKIKYYPPQSYNGDVNPHTFDDALSNRLDEI